MCGRYSFAPDLKIVNEHYNISVNDGDIVPNYNCAPGQYLPVITNVNPDKLSFFRWGLIPSWAKEESIGNRLINARSETVTEKASFRKAFRSQRCLVPADAFYEWKKTNGDSRKIPYRIYLLHQPLFSMAGLWEVWKNPEGELVFTFTILTTTPNELVADIHNRMPVILKKEDESSWLKTSNDAFLKNLLKPFPASEMAAYQISPLINSSKINTPEIIRPVSNHVK